VVPNPSRPIYAPGQAASAATGRHPVYQAHGISDNHWIEKLRLSGSDASSVRGLSQWQVLDLAVPFSSASNRITRTPAPSGVPSGVRIRLSD
jgi:hypothetical protein